MILLEPTYNTANLKQEGDGPEHALASAHSFSFATHGDAYGDGLGDGVLNDCEESLVGKFKEV